MGAASALWLPRARADQLQLIPRWQVQRLADDLRVTLHLRHERDESYEAAPAAIDVNAILVMEGRDPLRLVLEPTPLVRQFRMTRSGRRLERRIFVARDEVPYDTFSAPLPADRRGEGRLRLRARLRGNLEDYAERHRPVLAAIAQLRTTVPVQLA